MATKTTLNILLVDDEEIIHQTIGDYLQEFGHNVDSVFDGASGIKAIEEGDLDLALVDIRLPGLDGLSLLARVQEVKPDLSVVIITGHGDMETAIQALRLGAADFLPKPIKLLDLDAVLEKAMRIRRLRVESRHLRETIRGLQNSDSLQQASRRCVGESAAIQAVREQVELAVEGGAETILITGDTGVGKEVVAREIHFQSHGDESPFIAVNCPALPESLVEAELFGHMKGSFTGATADRAGYFELADGGTLFLDEIADLSASTQAKLLRVLETRSLRRLGGAREIEVNLRVVAATNRSLEQGVQEGTFRQDLYFRLTPFTIHLSPIRERREDILPLAEHFLSGYVSRRRLEFKGFSATAQEVMRGYDYPGNARELRNVVERAAILARGAQIEPQHLNLPGLPAESGAATESAAPLVSDDERSVIARALEETKWNRRRAAEQLGMPYSTLRYKIQKFGIS